MELSSKDGALSAEERQALIQGLRRTVEGAWTVKVGCARFTDCGCPYAVEFRHNLDGTATVRQTEGHQFHDPSSPEDLAKLSMHPTLRDLGWVLLECGVAPMMVRFQLNLRAQQDGLQGSSGSGVVTQASNARCNISISQVYALSKQVQRVAGVGVTSDAAAIEAMVAEYRQQGILPYYQPYRAGSSSKPSQPLVIVVQTPFQARMLAQFGRALVFCDSTYGVNKWGYPLYALVVSRGAGGTCLCSAASSGVTVCKQCRWEVSGHCLTHTPACLMPQVQDDVGRGVPVGFMICSSDTVEVVHQFLEMLRQGVSLHSLCRLSWLTRTIASLRPLTMHACNSTLSKWADFYLSMPAAPIVHAGAEGRWLTRLHVRLDHDRQIQDRDRSSAHAEA